MNITEGQDLIQIASPPPLPLAHIHFFSLPIAIKEKKGICFSSGFFKDLLTKLKFPIFIIKFSKKNGNRGLVPFNDACPQKINDNIPKLTELIIL